MNTYLFDFDGTLVDSMPTYVGTMLRILDDHNIPYESDIMKTITPLGAEGTAKYFIQMGVDDTLENIINTMKKYMLAPYMYDIPAKNNVVEVLKELKNRGASLNVLTASPHITLDACLIRLGIYDLFDNVWSCEDFNTTKSNPEIYVMAAEKLGQNINEIIFLDDNYNADKTAKEAGMIVCGVFDPSSEDYVDEIKAVSDYYIYDFKELLDI